MACRRSQVRSLSGPPFFILPRFMAGFFILSILNNRINRPRLSALSKCIFPLSNYILYTGYMFYKDLFTRRLILITLFLRLTVLGYVLFLNPLGTTFFTFPDSLNYTHPAHTLLEQGTLLEAYTNRPLTFRTPGYPLFLAIIWGIFGQSNAAVAFWQIILSTALIALSYQAARVFLSQTAARAAALLCAVSTVYWAYSFAYLSDVLFAFLITSYLLAALLYIPKTKIAFLLWASLLLTAAVFVRPVAYNMLFISLCLLVIHHRKDGVKKIAKTAAVLLLPFLLCTGAWQLRNWKQTGYTGFHSSAAYNLYYWNLDSVARANGLPAQEGSRLLSQALPPDFNNWPLSQQDNWFKQQAKPMILKYWPEKLLRAPYWLAKTLLGGSYTQLSRLFLGRPPLTEEEFSYQLNKPAPIPVKHLRRLSDWLLLGLCFLQTLLTAGLAFAGAFLLWKDKTKRNCLVFIGIYILYFWGISSTFFGAGGRYRAPFESALCILGGAAAAVLWNKLTRRKKPAR